jgi:hypothetical protein
MDEFELIKIAYEIGEHLKSFYTEDWNDKTKPCAQFSWWNDGPNPYWNQTKIGLVLNVTNESDFNLFTPWGKWTVLIGNKDEDWTKMMHGVVLVCLERGENECIKWVDWNITTWKGKKLPTASFMSRSEFRDYHECTEKFKKFANSFENTLRKE